MTPTSEVAELVEELRAKAWQSSSRRNSAGSLSRHTEHVCWRAAEALLRLSSEGNDRAKLAHQELFKAAAPTPADASSQAREGGEVCLACGGSGQERWVGYGNSEEVGPCSFCQGGSGSAALLENARLREALKPFAEIANAYDAWQSQGSTTTPDMLSLVYGGCRIGLPEYLAARQVLNSAAFALGQNKPSLNGASPANRPSEEPEAPILPPEVEQRAAPTYATMLDERAAEGERVEQIARIVKGRMLNNKHAMEEAREAAQSIASLFAGLEAEKTTLFHALWELVAAHAQADSSIKTRRVTAATIAARQALGLRS